MDQTTSGAAVEAAEKAESPSIASSEPAAKLLVLVSTGGESE